MRSIKGQIELFSEFNLSKINQSHSLLFALSILAGLFISFGASGSLYVSTLIPDGLGKVLGALVFSVGLILVVISGAELFTGDCGLILPLLERRISIFCTFKTLGFVYLGNFIGTLFFVVLFSIYNFPFNNDLLIQNLSTIIENKTSLFYISAFSAGILCNILVCLSIWMAFKANSVGSKIVAIIIPITTFVICGFEHSIANMFYGLAASFMIGFNFDSFFIQNLLPVTFGNLVGGCGIFAIYYFIAKEKLID